MAEIEFHCSWFKPCPLCNKCRDAAPHVYRRCQLCVFGNHMCNHTEDKIAMMIKRDNFVMTLDEETKKELKEFIDEANSATRRET